jgi:hypothetical protein
MSSFIEAQLGLPWDTSVFFDALAGKTGAGIRV